MSKGGNTPSGNTTTTSISDPWSGQQPYLTGQFQQAQNLYNAGGPQYYPGQTYAGPTDLQLQGIQRQADIGLQGTQAQNAANPALSDILGSNWQQDPAAAGYGNAASGGMANTMGVPELQGFASGQYTSADNPYFKQMADLTTANVLPGIQASFNSGNRLDSGLASRAAGQGLGDAIGNLAYSNYNQQLQQQQQAANQLSNIGFGNIGTQMSGLQGLSGIYGQNIGNRLQGLNLAPSIGGLDYQQATALQNAGQQTQQLNQAAINDALQRWNYGQQLPYQNLQNYAQNISGNYGGTQTTKQPYFNNALANTLGTGIGAYSLLNALSGTNAAGQSNLSNWIGQGWNSIFG